MAEDRDPPIQEMDFIMGPGVVDIGDYRVSRGMTRRPYSACKHRRLLYDTRERRVWCKDCEHEVESFDAFAGLVAQYAAAADELRRRRERLEEAETFQARALATMELDKVWRKRKMVPACPHCHNGLFPEDFKNGVGTMLGRDYAEARAAAIRAAKDTP
jgi:hypothetical protein